MMVKVGEYIFSRKKTAWFGLIMGVLIGVFNTFAYPIDFTLDFFFIVQLIAALVIVVFLHEIVHGVAAILLGYKPIFGIKPPLVYVTFDQRIPRGNFITVALAPLIVLNILFGLLFFFGIIEVFAYFALLINSMGAMGDIWIAAMLIRQEKGVWVQDTKTGIEIWKKP
ncbi:MAG: DUF3267 domain-containing protein [bacterium]|nr:DUF3267 domain-containing protein [bacterium]